MSISALHQHTLNARSNSRGPTVERFVMVDVTWAYCWFAPRENTQEQVGDRYRRLLTSLLNFSSYRRSPAGTWILHDPEMPAAESAARQAGDEHPISALYQWFDQEWRRTIPTASATCRPGYPEGRWWRSEADAAQSVRFIAEGLERCKRVATLAWMDDKESLLAAQMNLFACRIYLDPEQVVRQLTPTGTPQPSIPAHACIGFRFKEHLGRYRLYATFSAWTHRPTHATYAPNSAGNGRNGPKALPGEVADISNSYAGPLREAFRCLVGEHFHPAKMTILGREHRPPRFWFARITGRPTSQTIDAISSETLDPLADALLKVPDTRSAGVAAGVIGEQRLVLRRFVPDGDGIEGERPCYLVVSFLGEPHEVDKRERDARELLWKLTDLEASASAELFGVVADLDMYASHLRVYGDVVHQAEEFWDQLALHLPVTRGSRVHKLIELVHQTLLQGIADLDQVAIQADNALRTIKRSANDLKDQFDERFTERGWPRLPNAPSIRSSLTDTGYFDKAKRQAQRVLEDAAKIQYSYMTLLEGITRAFDERRVRGTDVVQRVGIALAGLLAGFAFLPEAVNAIFTRLPDYRALILPSIAGMVLFVLVGALLIVWGWRRGTLGSQSFRRHHRQIRAFLAECATDRLTRLRDAGWKRVRARLNGDPAVEEAAWAEFFAEWDHRDRALARQCAEILDALARDEAGEATWNDRPPRVKDLARQVERWALKAVLVAERPRQFWRFPAPRLTFLYRFYPMLEPELLSSVNGATEAAVVSDTDFRFTISNQCGGHHQQIGLIGNWAKRQITRSGLLRPSARRFVKALDKAGLHAGMTREDFEEMLRRMDARTVPRP